MQDMKKIGIIGSGIVARTLADGFLKHNYSVMMGSSSVEKLKEWKEKGGEHAHTGTFEDVAHFGELVILAVKGIYATEAIEMAGPQYLLAKTVIDVTNPIAETPPEDGVLRLFTSYDESLMERLQMRFPGIHFVKAFNCIGANYMVDPKFAEKPTMFICCNNVAAKKDVSHLLDQFGWEVADMGRATSARAIEPLCMLWCLPGFLNNSWNHAFRMIKAQ